MNIISILAIGFLAIMFVVDVIKGIQIYRDYVRKKRDDTPSLNDL